MKKLYYSLATLTALLCLNVLSNDDNKKYINTNEIQFIDMSDHTIYINLRKDKEVE